MNRTGGAGVRVALSPEASDRLSVLLLKYRHEAGLTQVEAGERANLDFRTISTFETGSRTDAISFAQLLALLDVYNVSLHRMDLDLFERSAAA